LRCTARRYSKGNFDTGGVASEEIEPEDQRPHLADIVVEEFDDLSDPLCHFVIALELESALQD